METRFRKNERDPREGSYEVGQTADECQFGRELTLDVRRIRDGSDQVLSLLGS